MLRSPQMSIQLAGLELLKFKASQLSDEDLLPLTKALIALSEALPKGNLRHLAKK